MGIHDVNSPIKTTPPPSSEDFCHVLPTVCRNSKVLLQDPSVRSHCPINYRYLCPSPGSFSGLEPGQLQGLQGAAQLRDDHEMLEFCLEMFQLNKEFRTLTYPDWIHLSTFSSLPKGKINSRTFQQDLSSKRQKAAVSALSGSLSTRLSLLATL